MVRLAIKNIRRDPWVQVRRSGNDQETVQAYAEAFDHLPPVEVIKTPDGYLLADGFHRITAAMLLGHDKIEANVRKGTHDDALELAALANLRHGQPFTKEDRNDAIRRLHQAHPRWSKRQLAAKAAVSQQTVSDVLAAKNEQNTRNDTIRRLHLAHPRWSQRRLAAEVGVLQETVSYVLSAMTRNDKIRSLHQAHPDWSQRRLAAKAGVSQKTVSNVLAAKTPQDAEPDDPTWPWPRWPPT